MDTYTKGVLTVIAVALVSISFQLSGTKPISDAHALQQIWGEVGICQYTGKCAGVKDSALKVYIVNK